MISTKFIREYFESSEYYKTLDLQALNSINFVSSNNEEVVGSVDFEMIERKVNEEGWHRLEE